jgi:nicotinamide mononucleotide (NMN) deamidase PncC
VDTKAARSILDLPENFFAAPGVGSREGAEILAQQVRRLAGADLGLCLTGLAAGKKEEDHQIYIALADSLRTESLSQRFPFTMRFIENRITKLTLEQVRKYLVLRISEKKR